MRADPTSTLHHFLQSCVDVGWPLAALFAVAAILITLKGNRA